MAVDESKSKRKGREEVSFASLDPKRAPSLLPSFDYFPSSSVHPCSVESRDKEARWAYLHSSLYDQPRTLVQPVDDGAPPEDLQLPNASVVPRDRGGGRGSFEVGFGTEDKVCGPKITAEREGIDVSQRIEKESRGGGREEGWR